MANFTEIGNGMPNIFNFIPEAGKSGSGINDLVGLLALSKDGSNNGCGCPASTTVTPA